ncbi:component of SufBCD complex [Roseovarius autotrophicus]|uniref:component of SufBCD complex n=1 Tax=Roseovarius autotrophicus TaxID=2824121 RepID=UPI0019FA9E49|nr:component of SufBCD complex [Roseovarius autotrophicus]MBE0453877.1 component of SufBCD complex [Roseovarius sp.]
MTFLDNVFELIDLRSFSNLWFWIALAVTWSTASHWVLGVPWDMALRARRSASPEAVSDFEDMVRINTNRILFVVRESGLIMAGLVGFTLTSLLLMGFVYDNEFSQALFLLGFPLTGVGLVSLRTARAIRREAPNGEALIARLGRHRLVVQIIGMVSIFVTAMWGMYQNMNLGVLG